MEYNEKVSVLKLISSHDEIGNIRTFVFEKDDLSWIAGQSQAYVLSQINGAEGENQRYFTISSAPSEGTINISTRISDSLFKQTLNKMKPGEEIIRFDLKGDFTWEDVSGKSIVMVAGGIGVTPFRSILVERDTTGKMIPATLLYFNRTRDVPFERELKKLEEKHKEFVLKIIIGENITSDKIIELAPQVDSQTVYLSGPEQMVESIGLQLRENGIVVKQDRFPGYDEKNY